jgi:hypothetical protein
MNPHPVTRILTSAAALVVAALALYQCPPNGKVAPVDVVDEVAATQRLLDERFSSPRYFVVARSQPQEEGGLWITDFDALAQVDRVVAERQLGTAATAKVRLLVTELAEPHPNRSVGGSRINLMRLNLLLDAVK